MNTERLQYSVDFILNRLLIIFFFAILIVYSSREIADLDLWLHLKTGEFIVKNGFVPSHDIFSFTMGSKPWINHEWLFQVIAYIFYALGHADGLILMQNIIVAATFLVIYLMGHQDENHVFVYVILYLTLLVVAYRFTIRPDILSLFFLASYLLLIKNFLEYDSRLIWLLPFLQVAWTNIHGFAFTGPLLILLFLIGEIFKNCLKLPYNWNQIRRLNRRQILELSTILVLLLASFLVNPQGLSGAAYPLTVLGQISGKGKVIFKYIQELARPLTLKTLFDLQTFTFYKAFILLSLFSFRFNQKNMNISDLLLWGVFFGFSLMAVRNIAYFGIVAVYIIFTNFNLAFEKGKTLPFRFSRRFKIIATYIAIAFLFYYPGRGALIQLEAANFSYDSYELKSVLWGVSELRYPNKAVGFLMSHELPARMFNDFNSGAYLVGHTYPRRLVFIDGRTELYGPDFFTEYVAIGEGKKDSVDRMIKEYDIQGFFLTNSVTDLHSGLLKYVFGNPEWIPVYFDDDALIFLKDTEDNKPLIRALGFDLRTWIPQVPDFMKIGIIQRYPWPYIQRGRMLDLLGCYAAAAREAQLALEVMPENAEALRIMANYYLDLKDYAQAFRSIRNCLIYTQGDTQIRTKLALVYHYLKEDEKALKVADAIIKNLPTFAEGYYAKAVILKDTDPSQSKDLLRQAIKLSPKETKYHEFMGDFLAEEGNITAAKKEWQAAYQYDSTNKELKAKLGI